VASGQIFREQGRSAQRIDHILPQSAVFAQARYFASESESDSMHPQLRIDPAAFLKLFERFSKHACGSLTIPD